MSPDILFWLALIVKMAVTAAFVVAATATAERAGPLVGGLVATLPISAGPAYVFLTLDHEAGFIAESALTSLVSNPAIAVFALVYALLARRHSLLLSFAIAIAVWVALVPVFEAVAHSLSRALWLHALILPVCLSIARPLRHAAIPRVRVRWQDICLRAGSVVVLVALVVALSFRIGPSGTGVLAVFPIVLTSVMVILHTRIGGSAASAVIANTITGLIGFGCALLTLHLAVVPLGPAIALPLALAVSFGWGLLVIGLRRGGLPL